MPIKTIKKAVKRLAGAHTPPQDDFAQTFVNPSEYNPDWQRKIAKVRSHCAGEIAGYHGVNASGDKTNIRHAIEMRLAEVFSKELRQSCLAADNAVFKQGMKEAKMRTPAQQETYLLELIHDISDENAARHNPPQAMSVAKKALYDLVNGIWVETTHPRGSQPDEAIAQLKSDKSKLIKKASNYKTKRDLLDTQINLEKAKRKFPHICNIVNEFLGIQTIAAPVEVIEEGPFVDRRADNKATDRYIPSAFASTPPTISGLSDSQSAGTLAPTTSRGHGEPAPSRP